jgi:hypothetical protein
MATTAGHRLTLDPMGKCSNAFFSETTNMIKAKLYMNVHWIVLYNLKVFCSDMKFKMAATAGLSLTLDPMGKMFQNASSLKLPHAQTAIYDSKVKLFLKQGISHQLGSDTVVRFECENSAIDVIINFL